MCINGLVDVGWLNLKSSAMYNCSKALPGRSGSGLCQLLTASTWPGTAMGCWGDRWIRSKWHCSKMIDLNMTYYNHKHYTHIHTLDKNGSLYDPAGTESWNMQIRYETMKLTMHPTNNRSTSEWSSGSESTSQRINKPAILSSAMSRRRLANK